MDKEGKERKREGKGAVGGAGMLQHLKYEVGIWAGEGQGWGEGAGWGGGVPRPSYVRM
jgi:hypothetical protein